MSPTRWRSAAVAAWEERGVRRGLCGRTVFTVDIPARDGEGRPPLLLVHGFPTSSFDFRHLIGHLHRDRRLLLLDLVGFGLSEKPDLRYTMDLQADVVAAFLVDVGVSRVAMLTHDMGDTVGGELLARQLEGRWEVEISHRYLLNGSIYIEMAHLSREQLFLLELPDERLADGSGPDERSVAASLDATASPGSSVTSDEWSAQFELIEREGGDLLLPRTIRYIEERRRRQGRFTGAIEHHPSPLTVIWGRDDPIAVPTMAERLAAARTDADVFLLDGVGHFPMIEAPDQVISLVAGGPG